MTHIDETLFDPSGFTLANKVAVITGASRGIGAAIAKAYAAGGANVVLSSRKQAGLEKIAAEIQDAGGNALPIAAHTGDPAAVEKLIAQTCDVFGGVDILVNNAATSPHFGPILTSEEGHWDKTLDVNLKGYFRLAQSCVPSMRRRGGGKIVNVASIAGRRPQPNMGIYCISKAGVLMLTEVLAAELAADNIQVNAIAPGYVHTHFTAAINNDPAFYARLMAQIPQGRMAEPEEIVGIALYLAAPVSSFTTGATFVVDGGHLVGGA